MATFFNSIANGLSSSLEPETITAMDKELPAIACEWKYTKDFGCFIRLALPQTGSHNIGSLILSCSVVDKLNPITD